MAKHNPAEDRRKRKSRKHNSSHPVPSFEKFDPIDSAAESLADAVMRESPRFKREKQRLKKVATRALSDSPFE